ncbi:MAG: formimidoylglutamate deiminase [Alphaproteobacteria bacterium]|nr:formimidoylglutamate deiminase [Alphaproteobacteria bacterium]
MPSLFARTALLPTGWAEDVLVAYDKDGWIVGVETGKAPSSDDNDVEAVPGVLVPGLVNAHSHAFQRALAGLTERGAGRKKSFWSWRDTMYRFVSKLSPDDMHALAKGVYTDMLKAGYTSVGEFHYLHHDPEGKAYTDIAEMSHQVIRAAMETGIAITHMPALYAFGGVGGQPAVEGQRRFLNTVPSLLQMLEKLQKDYAGIPQVSFGFAHHSLRAVTPDMLRDGTRAARRLMPDVPIHILAGAQRAEVEDCLAWSGLSPAGWLMEYGDVDENWSFIHALHMTEEDTRSMAAMGIVAVLCPTSEANHGAGVFPLLHYLQCGGRFAIGSASNVSVDALEELRWLEYLQRVQAGERVILYTDELTSVGATLFERTVQGGARALKRKTGRIAVGCRADFVVLDTDLPSMAGKLRDHVLDTAIFAAAETPVLHVMSGGRWAVRDRRHRREDQIRDSLRKVLQNLS